jgi:Ca2+-binding EF-hand superfamily protein
MKTLCARQYSTSTVLSNNVTVVIQNLDKRDQYECMLYYTLGFVSFMMFFLCVFVYITFWVTCVYFDSLIHKSLLIDNIDFLKSGRFGYKRVLEAMMEEEDHELESRERQFTFDQQRQNGIPDDCSSVGVSAPTTTSVSSVHPNRMSKSFKSYRELAKEMQEVRGRGNRDRDEYRSKSELRRSPQMQSPPGDYKTSQTQSFSKSVSLWVEKSFSTGDDMISLDIQDVFYRQSHWLYFRFVECSLFLQCVYVAFWCCQIMPLISLADQSHTGLTRLWVVVLTLPILLNFYLASQTVNKAVLIRSVCGLNREMIGVVCDEILSEAKALTEFRDRIRDKLEKGRLEPAAWKPFVHQLFERYDRDKSGSLCRAEFRLLLEDIDIYLGHGTFSLIWDLIDTDKSNLISWDELLLIVFPELKREIKLNLEVALRIRKEIGAKNNHINIKTPTEDSIRSLKLKFDVLDKDKSGELDKSEFQELLNSLQVNSITERSFHILFSCIDSSGNKDGKVSFDEFLELVYPQAFKNNVGNGPQNSKIPKSPFSHGRSPIYSPQFSISDRFDQDDRNSVSIRNPNSYSNRNVTRPTDSKASSPFTSPKQHMKLDDTILNILSGVNHATAATAPNSSGLGDDPLVCVSKENKEADASAAAASASRFDGRPLSKPQKPKPVAASGSVRDVPKDDVKDGASRPPANLAALVIDSPESFSPPAPESPHFVEESDAPSASGMDQRLFDPVEPMRKSSSSFFGNSTILSTEQEGSLTPRRKAGSPGPFRVPISDRDDMVVFAVPKGSSELGLGLVDDHLELIDSPDDDIAEMDGDAEDGLNRGPKSKPRTVAHVRVASIRSINKNNKPHPSGLRVNDVIRAVNGQEYDNYDDLVRALTIERTTLVEPYLQFELSRRGDQVEYADSNKREGRRSAKNKLLIKAVKKMSWVL